MNLHYGFQKVIMVTFLITATSILFLAFETNKNDYGYQINKKMIYSEHVSKVANLWTVLRNDGFIGNQTLTKPSFEWPGGSGNHHMY
jgi:hypothetical protein